ncbi:MAG: LysE family translocator [Haloferacaceae archaeon]
MSVAATLAAGAVFGLALAAPPGPMNAVIAEESVLRGWSSGFRAGLGAMSADGVFFVLASLGVVAFVERFPVARALMAGAGGLLMCYFAYGAARDALATDAGLAADLGADRDPAAVESRGFRKAFVLALTNPYQVLFWLTVGVKLIAPGRLDPLSHAPYVGESLRGALVVTTGSPALLVGFFAGILVWIVAFPAALVAAGRRVDALAPLVAGISAVVLAGFGVAFLGDAAGTLLPALRP